MDTLLKAVHDVSRMGIVEAERKINRYFALNAPPSPAVERGTKRNPIALSPAGKFQRLIDAADRI